MYSGAYSIPGRNNMLSEKKRYEGTRMIAYLQDNEFMDF